MTETSFGNFYFKESIKSCLNTQILTNMILEGIVFDQYCSPQPNEHQYIWTFMKISLDTATMWMKKLQRGRCFWLCGFSRCLSRFLHEYRNIDIK